MARPLIGITTRRLDSPGSDRRENFGLLFAYVDAVRLQGGLPALLPLGLADDELRELFDRLDGLVLSGGGDVDPRHYGSEMTAKVGEVDYDRDRIEIALARWAVQEEKPFLAICRGIQVLNVALGGALWRDIATDLPNALHHTYYPGYPRNLRAHAVRVEEETQLARALGSPFLEVNSLHHQACSDVAPELRVVATAPDGVIEGLEVAGPHPFGVGVQWHPEWMQDAPAQCQLFASLVAASQNGRAATGA